jgi:hypothetical protein
MNLKYKEEIAAGSLLAAFLAWTLYHFYTSHNQTAVSNQIPKYIPDYGVGNVPLATTEVIGVTPLLNTAQSSALSPVTTQTNPTSLLSTSKPCPTCPASPYVIASIATMAATAETYANAIIDAGNATLEALASMGEEENPLLQVTVG